MDVVLVGKLGGASLLLASPVFFSVEMVEPLGAPKNNGT